jgi:hypothetical protein
LEGGLSVTMIDFDFKVEPQGQRAAWGRRKLKNDQ